MQDPLFLIALLPDKPLQKEVTALKHFCAENFGASHSLNSPPHITLVPPFSWREADLLKLVNSLNDFAAEQKAFEVKLKGFGSFPPRVIFIAPEPNKQLTSLASTLSKHLETSFGLHRKNSYGFNPHMTIAHRDLQQQVFPEAWAHFSKMEFTRNFKVDSLTLLRHEHKKWKEEKVFAFA